jgi:anti-sigma factor RsiW
MSCEHYHEAIGAWVDGTLDVIERREIEDHLAACERCAALAADLRHIRDLARGLDRLSPPSALWDRVASETRIGAGSSRPQMRPVWIALAAAAVLVLAVGIVALRRSGPSEVTPRQATRESTTSVSPVDLANSVEAELRLAEQHYENAIAGLEQLARDRTVLDPQVAATLHKNLQVIDTAIGESRAALRAQPANDSAQQSLFDAFRTKIALLEDTIALLNELRQTGREAPPPTRNGESL